LSRVISNGDQKMLELLCSYGAARAVHLLAHYNDLQTAAAVFAANPALADDPEALGSAASDAFVRLLLRYQPDLPTRVTVAKSREVTELLFRQGMDPSRPDWLGITPMHEFARQGDIEKAAIFLDHGADAHARDEDICSTPLGWAAKFGRKPMVEFLLQRGAKPDLPDDPPWTRPLAWAARRGHAGITELLERHGAK
jgi:ankyrin repeat protein